MGAIELKFSGTFEKSNYLKEFCCGFCQKEITNNDIQKGNYNLYVSDYANEVSKDKFFSQRLGRSLTTYGLNFWLKAVEHQACPEEEE